MGRSFYGWGYMVDRNHDQGRVAHLLREDGRPACGASYYASAGQSTARGLCGERCRRCEHIALVSDGPRVVRSLARQDTAGGVDDSYARTGDAEDTIARWLASGQEAGDRELVAVLTALGTRRAAKIYRAARRVVEGV